MLAGHFFWGIWNNLPSCRDPGTKMSEGINPVEDKSSVSAADKEDLIVEQSSGAAPTPVDAVAKLPVSQCFPSCLIMGRHPVDRAISYYYQRCYQLETCIGHNRRINTLTPEELEWVVIHERQAGHAADNTTIVILDEGMENAACRSVTGLKATSGIVFQEGTRVPLPEPLEPEVTPLALANVKQCTVGILERWNETIDVMGLWFPWMDFTSDPQRRKMWLYSGKETKDELRPDLYEVLVRHNGCDMRLYDEMTRLFDRQMEIVDKRMFATI